MTPWEHISDQCKMYIKAKRKLTGMLNRKPRGQLRIILLKNNHVLTEKQSHQIKIWKLEELSLPEYIKHTEDKWSKIL